MVGRAALSGDGFKHAMSMHPESRSETATRHSVAFVALETDKPVDSITIDDLPIGRAPRPLLQVLHDPATFAQTGKPCTQGRRIGGTQESQHHALGSEWPFVPGHVGAGQRDPPAG